MRALFASLLVLLCLGATAEACPAKHHCRTAAVTHHKLGANGLNAQIHAHKRFVMSVGAPGITVRLGGETQLISIAKSQLGAGAIYGRRSLWCARFVNWALQRSGFRGTNSDMARSFLKLPHTAPRVGAIAVLARGHHAGHVGIVIGFDGRGNPVLLSGNHSHRVGIGAYPRKRVLAYVLPT